MREWDEYFMAIARVVASRSSCSRRQVGSIITIDRRIISTGYNGTPRGVKNCNEGGCTRCASSGDSGRDLNYCVCSHAEENAIVQAAYHGVAIKDGIFYTTDSPCTQCCKMILNAGIRKVVYGKDYKDHIGLDLLKDAGIGLTKWGNEERDLREAASLES